MQLIDTRVISSIRAKGPLKTSLIREKIFTVRLRNMSSISNIYYYISAHDYANNTAYYPYREDTQELQYATYKLAYNGIIIDPMVIVISAGCFASIGVVVLYLYRKKHAP